MINRFIKRLSNNWPYKLAALILAVMLRFYVSATNNPQRTKDIDISVVHVPDNFVQRDATSKVTLHLSGPANALDDLRPTDITAIVDASTAHTGVNRGLPIQVTVVPDYRDRITIDSKTPPTAMVNLEALDTVRRSVHVLFTHAAAPGYTYGPPVFSPITAKVIAPESEITDIHDLVVDVDSRMDDTQTSDAEPVNGHYEIVARDDAGRPIEGATVIPPDADVTIPIVRVASIKTAPVSPTIVGKPSPTAAVLGAVVYPPFVTLSGAADDLARIGVVMTAPIDVSGATSDIRRTTTLMTPPGVAVSTTKSVTVTVEIGAPPKEGPPDIRPEPH
jgi:YbbR domain-containing protein